MSLHAGWSRLQDVGDPAHFTFEISRFNATTHQRCGAKGDSEFGSGPAGTMRMDDGQDSITVQNQLGEKFTITYEGLRECHQPQGRGQDERRHMDSEFRQRRSVGGSFGSGGGRMMTMLARTTRKTLPLLVACLTCVLVVACGAESANEQTRNKVAPADTQADMPAPVATSQPEVPVVSELGGTSWHLVEIKSMDDHSDKPADPSHYTLEFNGDGTASMLADCNRGSASWKSEAAGQLTFGPVAATMAMCPPESISETYFAQFERVRSYVMKNGHLFLATMADGSIIEFEPAEAAAPVGDGPG